MSDRKVELERKKAKLQAMREEKKRKEEQKRKKGLDESGSDTGQDSSRGADDKKSDADQMLQELGINLSEVSPKHTAKAAAPQTSQVTVGGGSLPVQAEVTTTGRKVVNLTTSKVTQTNIAPRENVSYCKETQTATEQVEASSTTSNSPSVGNSPRYHQSHAGAHAARSGHRFDFPNMEWDNEFSEEDDADSTAAVPPTPPPSSHMPHVQMAPPAETPYDLAATASQAELPPPPPELTEEQLEKIRNSDDFLRFFDRSSKIIERVLYEDTNMFIDYSGGDLDDNESGLGEGEKLKLNRQFFDERWTKHRTVTSMDWSTQHPELLVASYNNNEDAPHDPDGAVLVWNVKYKKPTPEFVFHCQSPVMSTCFAKFHPNLILGGTYSGRIVLWDNRSNKRTPVQRTPLSAVAHTHPVYCVDVVGTQNAHNLISVSSDGKVCSWSLDMFSQPQDHMELQHKQQTKSVAATCLSFFAADVNNFVVGSEDGAVYTACRHGSKAGINDIHEGHHGPITGIDCHAALGSIDFSPYFITSSFDWTIKLWNVKDSRPLHSFEDNSDYVYDVKWSPTHPALFATVNGLGRLDLWNLNNDIEVPTVSVVADSNVALNKVSWQNNGHLVCAGDDAGRIHLYDVGELLANPPKDAGSRFAMTLAEMRSNRTDEDDEATLISTFSR